MACQQSFGSQEQMLCNAQMVVNSKATTPEFRTAGRLACWLIIEKDYTKRAAAKVAAKKHAVTQAGVLRLIDQAIPLWLLDEKSRYAMDTARPSRIAKEGRRKVAFALAESTEN